MPRLYLVRHAEPQTTGLLLGWADPPLSPAGREQARRALADLRAGIVYSSPLRRALETAHSIPAGAPVQVLHELKEISYGSWDGKSWAEIQTEAAGSVGQEMQDWFAVTPPGGEGWDLFRQRIGRALARIRRGPFPAIVVAHAAVNAELAHRIAGTEPAEFIQDYCGVIEYDL